MTATASRGTVAQRLRARLVALVAWVVGRLPEGLAIAMADAAGELWYRVTPARAALARRQLQRVAEALADRGVGPARARAAATQPRALEGLVRAAYRHAARYYLELAQLPRFDQRFIRERLLIETPDVVESAFGQTAPVIFVGMHFGAIELPGLYLARRSGRQTTVPMETIADPALQRWIVRTRDKVGLRIVDLAAARRALVESLRRGDPVGLVADRDIGGTGAAVTLFGHRARLPIGPALLAMESGAPVYLAAVRRDGPGRYRGRMMRIEIPTTGTRRARLEVSLANLAAGFESAVADAPEQWWGVFHPIWPDLADARAIETGHEPAGTAAR